IGVVEQQALVIAKEFEKSSGIKVNFVRMSGGETLGRIRAEKQSPKASVWYGGPADSFIAAKKEGLLEPYKSKNAEGIAANFKDPEGYYYAGRLINMVIAYNTKALTPETAPKSWKELTDEKWYDNYVVPNPEYSGAAVAAVGALAKKYGWKYFEDLRENEAVVVRGNSDVAQKVAAGEFPIGMTLDYIARDLNVKGSPIDIIYPTDGTIAIPSPIAILKSSQKMEAAMKFVNYILSIDGQKAQVELGSLVPVRSDVNPPANTPPAGEILGQAMEIDWKYIEEGLAEINTNFSDIMLF
ncbi:MAG TPA: extracellular solute-binding protein, partial [Mesotoga sp.]|nr:extracellular solute-binding protein [Mesotoga sp.]